MWLFRAACSWLSGTHLTPISSPTVPAVGFGSAPWIRHALTHSTDCPLLPVVTGDNDLCHGSRVSHLDWAQEWSVRLYGSARWYVCVTGHIRLQLLVCTHTRVVMQLRNGWFDPDKTGVLSGSCFSFGRSFLPVKEQLLQDDAVERLMTDGFFFSVMIWCMLNYNLESRKTSLT